MSKKSLLSYSAVGNDGETGTNNDPNIDTETEVDSKVSTNIEQFYAPEKKPEKKQVSIYLDEDVIKAFNRFGRKEGKGAKSELINNFLKEVFNIKRD
jgi:uncharacterized protein (DUF4415 family)